MLHLETVDGRSFTILKELMLLPNLKDFCLVGGTALSLLYGHRISDDIDLFSNSNFENQTIIDGIISKFPKEYRVRTSTHFGIFGYIGDLKLDIVRTPHPLIRPIVEIDGIRMFSPEDIIAMKVQAILGRGKKKDFWDIAELLNHFSVKDFVEFHKEKYSTQNLLISVPQTMVYFDDADESEEPISLKNQTWKSVKKQITETVRAYLS
ncbi:MAG: nucleotidyl transferase AbiEii/AbiGii toxin family protein [Cytophagaceae bacterium]|nr:nucleotidyl transferase AbiEii/AbiGii toxin family protein [Cytophagaceae bacterium]MBK9510417.1 nucleotidyl transferase AbiEii/AbiGii toxin family protein [Cytophagaceae bacterium]MBK9935989.1 nucleotidyl transferase AbiEii/AbiGii toxin family protein [Cytophagaceae bacterium]MBL0304127.1 nucleotidyl transferase AbiEii/AbiGii toxin family protein [Cytophagaceae bacterium]MBL0326936.1 nucleotidyl transferase AbiEii/AbiGii toxin family protein [Cytophagaceae bacterium]